MNDYQKKMNEEAQHAVAADLAFGLMVMLVFSSMTK
jgi:hypothetical protein